MKRVSSTRPRVRIRRTPVPSLVVAVQVTGTGARLGGQHVDELVARADVELAEDLAEVVLGSPRADEQPGGDLRVREAIAGQARNLDLLGRQVLACVVGALAGAFAGRHQPASRAPRERLYLHRAEHLAGETRAPPRRRSRRSHSPYSR